MNKLIIALIAGTFAAVASAQAPAPAAATTAEKQKAVEATTKAGTDATSTMAAEKKGVADAKAAKGTAKALPTKDDKQKAVAGTTAGAVKKDGSN